MRGVIYFSRARENKVSGDKNNSSISSLIIEQSKGIFSSCGNQVYFGARKDLAVSGPARVE
ncbi:hypothetical protein LJE71_20030 [Xanthobacter autotrophicus]|uniref:hypothetical protein n=1 Tax=Xanthobacter autotrophicus TaxID=280 RepID=UPI001E4479E6|nr:hypothetical protein [Xanthobacter autotrophicus]UDQ88506.1 hypothetical protein LJE71_20030 [Xanthobacter autotrophicus]